MGFPVVTLHGYMAPVAQGSDKVSTIGTAPFAGTVTSITYIPDSTVTGAATHNRVFSAINKGTVGTGTTSVASLTMSSGVVATGYDEKAITLSGTAANLVVAAGDVLTFSSVHAGSGIADPGGLVKITIARTAGS